MECAFCSDENVRARKVTENNLAWAFPTNTPITPGHMLIATKRHVALMQDLTQDERDSVLELSEKVKRALEKTFATSGFNVAYNEGEVAGQNIPHFHMHIVPRKEGDTGITEYEPRKFLYRPGSRAESPQEELLQVAERVRAAL